MDAKMNKKQDIVKLAKAGNEPAEFALGKKGILICPEDDSYYFKKSWHNGRRAFLNRRENHDLSFRKVLCPADNMITKGLWEGKVIIENLPKDKLTEIKNLIRNFDKIAQAKDTLDRVIKVDSEKGNLIVTTTENQMAHKLAKKIHDAFKKVSLKTSYQKPPGDAEIVWVKFQ